MPTTVSIGGEQFFVNNRPTYEGRTWRGIGVEGLLLNSRMVQATFDDRNPETVGRWAYPDTGRWDAERNVREFLAAMPLWRAHGLLGITVNFQGGSPTGYSKEQPWHNSAFEADGSLRDDYLARMKMVLDRADELGMVVILGIFYFGQDHRLTDEAAVRRGLENAIRWTLATGHQNVLIEIANECNIRYVHRLIRPPRIVELIEQAKSTTTPDGRRLQISASFSGNAIPSPEVIQASDFVLIHGNGVGRHERITEMVELTRQLPTYRPMPVVFNEDDHFDFEKDSNNCLAALRAGASGNFDPGQNNYADGYQCPPVNWGINTPRKKGFFDLVRQITGV